MKLALLALMPGVALAQTFCERNPNFSGCPPTGFCAGAKNISTLSVEDCEVIGQPHPCYEYDYEFLTDCDERENQDCRFINDAYCDDEKSIYAANFNCATYNYDGGDCETVYDCDGNLQLANLVSNGACDDGSTFEANFDCFIYDYDGEDCPPRDCDGNCLGDYPNITFDLMDFAPCRAQYDCKKFIYDGGNCFASNFCSDDWYSVGRSDYRCSTRTGGQRYASTVVAEFDACECHEFCLDKAEEENVTLTAFDYYSDKCRCWTGDCTDATTIECRGLRCPSATYFPNPQQNDCHPGGFEQDVTRYIGRAEEEYYNDGFCDNAQFGAMDFTYYDFSPNTVPDYNCEAFNLDGNDCADVTCDEIFEITQFAVLDDANMICDGHNGEIYDEAQWTTACECYSFCNTHGNSSQVAFQRDNNGMCQCVQGCSSQSNCGLESDCQIFYVEPIYDCCGTDWTLGRYVGNISDDQLGQFNNFATASQQRGTMPKVITYDVVQQTAEDNDLCVPEFLCAQYDYSFGEADTDGSFISSPCFDCQAKTQDQLDSITTPELRCDKSSNDAVRFLQLSGYYLSASFGGDGRTPFDLADYCGCEIQCRLAKFELYANGDCPSVEGYRGYLDWLANPSVKFAVDSYKGDCRCWDYCTNETLWTCTIGEVDRCALGPVGVVLWAFLDAPINLPPDRPNGGTN